MKRMTLLLLNGYSHREYVTVVIHQYPQGEFCGEGCKNHFFSTEPSRVGGRRFASSSIHVRILSHLLLLACFRTGSLSELLQVLFGVILSFLLHSEPGESQLSSLRQLFSYSLVLSHIQWSLNFSYTPVKCKK